MDSTEMAETRILAKKMLRKKQRSEILDMSYNRYSFHEDPKSLPSWFVEDETKNYFRHYNPTKEEIAVEKEEIKAYNARPSKKVEEAKARKKRRLVKAL
jgi:AdoMet-dependent rRNA methyltransferase SPB1